MDIESQSLTACEVAPDGNSVALDKELAKVADGRVFNC